MSDAVVWLVGAGVHAAEYAKVLTDLGVKYEVIGRGAESAAKFEEKTGHSVHLGGVEPFLAANPISPNNTSVNAIVTVSIPSLASCTIKLIQHGVNRILFEKPGGRNSEEIAEVLKVAESAKADGRDIKIRMAYNRRFYSSVRKARELAEADGGITSFVFEFTEWSHIIGGLPHPESVKQSWFLGNSHVLDLAFFLGGQPKDLQCHHAGQGEVFWHPQASIWVGSGITEKNALFSYHANWAAPGRWWLEVLTRKNRYIFRPLEKLHVTRLGSVKVEEIEIDDSLDKKFKPGLWLQTKTFLDNPDDEDLLPLSHQLEHVQKYYEPMRGTDMSKLPAVLIVGAGNIGSRHLQSLACLDIAVDVVVVEPVEACRTRAKSIFDNEAKANPRTKVVYVQSLDEVTTGRKFDVVIIATTSTVRRKVVTNVLDQCKVSHMILEKVLFQTAEDHRAVLALLKKSGVNAYVNSQYAAFPLGKYLKEKIQGPVNFHIHGQGWGLCCNGLHMIVLAKWLNDNKAIEFNGSTFNPGYEASKRQDFVEIFGTLKGQIKTEKGTADVSIVCLPGPMAEGRILRIKSPNADVFWNEQNGTLFGSFAENNWEWERKELPSLMVSRFTHLMVKQMLESGTCELPKYEDVMETSIALNDVFIEHLVESGHEAAKNGVCPIT